MRETGNLQAINRKFIKFHQTPNRKCQIEQQSGNIAQVAYASGFGNPSWFSRCFREYAGVTPYEYVKAQAKSS